MASQPAVPTLEAAAAAIANVGCPIYHIAPRTGWVNDPNGPLLWNGRYHLFYQHLNAGSSWSWGLSWGHCSSADLVYWQHHDPALVPAEHTFDADGCFSGCAVVAPAAELAGGVAGSNREEMVPVLLYTGVVKREDAAPCLLPSSLTVSELCLERQLAAVPAQPSDPFLQNWHKYPSTWLMTPATGLCLNCFRDPFVLERPSAANGQRWWVMLGGGIRQLPAAAGLPCAGVAAQPAALQDKAEEHQQEQPLRGAAVRDRAHSAEDEGRRMAALGTALVYSSQFLLSGAGWQFEGLLCSAGDPGVEGRVWECPVLAQVPLMRAPPVANYNHHHQQQHQQQSDDLKASTPSVEATPPAKPSSSPQEARSHFFCVSTGCSPSIYWLGRYHAGGVPETTCGGGCRSGSSATRITSTATFDLAGADGPISLDLGDVLYAPNVLTDAQGRLLLWGWLQELPNPGGLHDYAGCISLPRQLQLTRSPTGHTFLHQQPLPELVQLHWAPYWQQVDLLVLQPGAARHIGEGVPAHCFDLVLTFQPAGLACPTGVKANTWTVEHNASTGAPHHQQQASCVAGIVLPPWTSSWVDESSSNNSQNSTNISGSQAMSNVQQGAVLLYDFQTCKLSVTVGQGLGSNVQLSGHTDAAEQAGIRVLGGILRLLPFQPVQLRLLMDFSVLEVFADDGQTHKDIQGPLACCCCSSWHC